MLHSGAGRVLLSLGELGDALGTIPKASGMGGHDLAKFGQLPKNQKPWHNWVGVPWGGH